MKKQLFTSFLLIFLLFSCKEKAKKQPSSNTIAKSVEIKYAKLFSVEQTQNYKKITIKNPWDATEEYATYYLIPKDKKRPNNIPKDGQIIRTPIKNIAVLSTPHIGILSKLENNNCILAVGDSKYIYNPQLKSALKKGTIKEVGGAYSLNIEQLIALKPEAVIATGLQVINENLKQAKSFKIPVIYGLDWMEQTPLARAEWIKFMALFTENEEKATSLFSQIENNYLTAKNKLKGSTKKTSVLVGQEWKGVWNTPGGKSYFALLLKDAGADYYWSSDKSSGSLALSFEEIFDKQSAATIWLNPGQVTSTKQLLSQDKKLQHFRAVKNKEIYGYFNKINSEGANAYWEIGGVNPDVILLDLIKILHPEVLPNYELFFYKKLD